MKNVSSSDLLNANALINKQKNLLTPKPKYPLGMKELAPDYKLSLSEKSKDLAKDMAVKPLVPPEAPEVVKPDVDAPNIGTPDIPDLPDIDIDIEDTKDVVNEVKKLEKVKTLQLGSNTDPGIYFLGGLEWFSVDMSTGSYNGINDMSKYVEGAEYFGWDDKSAIIDAIKSRTKETPVILVGHSLGGDTAVEIANELNTLENGFRKVDLLFTIDSWGMGNDIIPANVEKNVHYFSNSNRVLNDGPNWPANESKTIVENNLLKDDHTDLDDNLDVQAHLLAEIESIV